MVISFRNELVFFALAVFGMSYQPGFAQDTAFTYQGRLDQSGSPVNAAADFEFSLFDDATTGNLVAGPVSVTNVAVADGLFTVQIDFGGAAFNGQGRWLGIAARSPAGAGPFTTLSPRQKLTATPYALKVPGVDGFSLDAADGSPTDAVFVDNAGLVGIGTTTPQAPLHLLTADEAVRIQGSSSDVDNQAYLTFTNGDGTRIGYVGDGSTGDDSVFLAAESGDVTLVTQAGRSLVATPLGDVGIGTTAPVAKLHVAGGDLILGAPDEEWILHARSHVGGDFFQITDRDAGDGNFKWGQGLTIDEAGNVGIGTVTPIGGLNVAREPQSSGGTLALEGSTHTFMSFYPQGRGAGRKAWLGFGGAGTNEISLWNDAGPINLVTAPGSATRVSVLEITGADLAEKFPASECLEPGMVVAIDPQNPGKMCLSRGAYNRCVAGVISGANDFSAGAVLGNLPGSEDAPPVALSGRVYVHCDASGAAIQPGDLLTTSDTPGHAMKALDRERSHGAVIGKAMSALPSGQGLVLVLVSLQ